MEQNKKLSAIGQLSKICGINSAKENIISHFHTQNENGELMNSKFILNFYIIITDIKSSQRVEPEKIFNQNVKKLLTKNVRLDEYSLSIQTDSYKEAIDYFHKRLKEHYVLVWKKPYKAKTVLYTLDESVYTPDIYLCKNFDNEFFVICTKSEEIVFYERRPIGVTIRKKRN